MSSLTESVIDDLIHTNFTDEVQRMWDRGIDWPCWDQIIAAVPEMSYMIQGNIPALQNVRRLLDARSVGN
jgi:hypothetical protein